MVSRRPSFAQRIEILDRALTKAGISHGFGGAVALAYYVEEPRATRDIDVNVSTGTDLAGEVLAALPSGIAIPASAAQAIAADGQIRLWWDGDGGIPIDLFFPQHQFHQEVERDTVMVPFLQGTIPVISATHLTVFKALFNRSRDWPDIEAMLAAGSVDAPRALDWVRSLVGTDSPSYERLAALVGRAAAGHLAHPGEEMVRPAVDWRSLGQ
jgi:hypothetical protein